MAMRYYAPFPGGGEPPLPRGGPHALRIGDAEREAAATDLGEHYAAGRLSLDELNERLDAVFSSTTFGQLSKIMADLPGSGRLLWPPRPSRSSGWLPADFPSDAGFGMGGFRDGSPQPPPTSADRAGRVAALSLLLLAMLIWLFTALLFARHGFYHQYGPYGPPGTFSHYVNGGFQPGGPQSPVGP